MWSSNLDLVSFLFISSRRRHTSSSSWRGVGGGDNINYWMTHGQDSQDTTLAAGRTTNGVTGRVMGTPGWPMGCRPRVLWRYPERGQNLVTTTGPRPRETRPVMVDVNHRCCGHGGAAETQEMMVAWSLVPTVAT